MAKGNVRKALAKGLRTFRGGFPAVLLRARPVGAHACKTKGDFSDAHVVGKILKLGFTYYLPFWRAYSRPRFDSAAMNRKTVTTLRAVVRATISPASFTLPPSVCAMGVEATAVGEAKTARSAAIDAPR